MSPMFLEPEVREDPRCKKCGALIRDNELDALEVCENCIYDEAEHLIKVS